MVLAEAQRKPLVGGERAVRLGRGVLTCAVGALRAWQRQLDSRPVRLLSRPPEDAHPGPPALHSHPCGVWATHTSAGHTLVPGRAAHSATEHEGS
jgi:hypothetical protein